MVVRLYTHTNIHRTPRFSRTASFLGILVFATVSGDASRVSAASVDAATSAPSKAMPAVQSLGPGVPPRFAELAKKLERQFPEYAIDGITESGVDGIVEVLVGGRRILYSDLTGKHVFNGHLFDAEAHEDLTARRLAEITRIDYKQLPLADAFDVVRGNGKREVYIFSDPDCPFCKKLEDQLPMVNDVTVHVFLYPLTRIHPHAYEHALGIWCSKDRQKAWSEKMLQGIDPANANCDNPIARNLALGEKLHFDGTPTMIFAGGRVHAGAVSAEEFEHLLSRAN
jgi:thiol:disulfide interchange protein DsbC